MSEDKNPAAVKLGRKGGLVGGPARAAKLSPEKRKQIAVKAANKRWGNIVVKDYSSVSNLLPIFSDILEKALSERVEWTDIDAAFDLSKKILIRRFKND